MVGFSRTSPSEATTVESADLPGRNTIILDDPRSIAPAYTKGSTSVPSNKTFSTALTSNPTDSMISLTSYNNPKLLPTKIAQIVFEGNLFNLIFR
jgi:hypothetical protein